MNVLKWVSSLMVLTLTVCISACGDDEKDEPDGPNNGGGGTQTGLTIDGQKWSNVVSNEFRSTSPGEYYFDYETADLENGTRIFSFYADADAVDEKGEIAKDIEIRNLGDLTNINLRDMSTEYISGKVKVQEIGLEGIVLNFENYQFYYYPDSEGTSSKYKHTVTGTARFSGTPNEWK